MGVIGQIFKTIVTVATLLASVEAIVKLARFAWNLFLLIVKRAQPIVAGARGVGKVGRMAWKFGFAR